MPSDLSHREKALETARAKLWEVARSNAPEAAGARAALAAMGGAVAKPAPPTKPPAAAKPAAPTPRKDAPTVTPPLTAEQKQARDREHREIRALIADDDRKRQAGAQREQTMTARGRVSRMPREAFEPFVDEGSRMFGNRMDLRAQTNPREPLDVRTRAVRREVAAILRDNFATAARTTLAATLSCQDHEIEARLARMTQAGRNGVLASLPAEQQAAARAMLAHANGGI